jgi:hypothetical protein
MIGPIPHNERPGYVAPGGADQTQAAKWCYRPKVDSRCVIEHARIQQSRHSG